MNFDKNRAVHRELVVGFAATEASEVILLRSSHWFGILVWVRDATYDCRGQGGAHTQAILAKTPRSPMESNPTNKPRLAHVNRNILAKWGEEGNVVRL